MCSRATTNASNSSCPPRPTFVASFRRPKRSTFGLRPALGAAVRFELRLRDSEGATEEQLLSVQIGPEDEPWHQQTLDLDRYSYRSVELCVETEALGPLAGGATEELAFWESPGIASRGMEEVAAGEEAGVEGLSEEEIEVRRKHLRAMGYVN